MKKYVLIPWLFLQIFIFASRLISQEAHGTWNNAQYNLQMTLNRDGTYSFTGPYGSSAGRWGAQGSTFWMQDYSGQTVYYTVALYNQTQLNLVDANGVSLHYTRKTGASGSVLLEYSGHSLTTKHLNTAIGIIEFIIGQEIKAIEKEELTASAKEEFPLNPAEWLRQVSSLQESLDKLKQLQDPVHIGMARQMLVAEFYKAVLPVKEEEKPLLIRMINRYVKVLAFDEANTLALTDKDVDAMIDYMEFNNQMAGVNRRFTIAERKAFTEELSGKFKTMPVEEKRFLCSANFIWKLVQANYQQLGSASRNQFQQQYSTAHAGRWKQDKDFQAFSNLSQAEQQVWLQQKSRENLANQNMYTMMNNMATQNHAVMLNTIENFGGTGNYWEVVNTNY